MDTYNDFNNQSEWLLVTPQVAQELLKTQIKNRPLNHFTVKKYANDMANGNWQQCGDTICVDKNGCLTDGQHRLHAIIESGIAVGKGKPLRTLHRDREDPQEQRDY